LQITVAATFTGPESWAEVRKGVNINIDTTARPILTNEKKRFMENLLDGLDDL
jgi:hypothetical protein